MPGAIVNIVRTFERSTSTMDRSRPGHSWLGRCPKTTEKSAFSTAGGCWHDGRDGRSCSALATGRQRAVASPTRTYFGHDSVTAPDFGVEIRSSGVPGISRLLRMEGGGDHGGRYAPRW